MPNVILVICDTLRHDALGLRNKASTPNVSALLKDSMIYDNCIAPETWTFPSHASLFTGMYANEHGIHETKDIKLDGLYDYNSKLKTERLAERLQSKGYDTIGISNNYMVSRYTGFDYGFDFFFNIDSSPWGRSRLATEAKTLGSDTFQVVKELVKRGRIAEIPKFAREYLKVREATNLMDYPREKGAKLTVQMLNNMSLKEDFFLFINFWELHDPYKGQSEKATQDNFTGVRKMSESHIQYLREEYAREANHLYEQLDNMIAMLKRRDLYDNTMIIITSDHAQAFNEHGFMLHGIYLYDEIIRVPLVIKYPKGKKFRQMKGYQSLVSIPKLIGEVVEGGDDGAITTEKAFSEAYGNIDRPPLSYKNRMDFINRTYEKSRTAVYKDGYKLNVNGSDGVVEEFLKDGKNVDVKQHRKAFDDLADELACFKKKEKFTIPDA
jgi:arylsulfatase A-like enzyme